MPPRSAAPSLERKLPLLISALLALVVVVYCWAAYREERASSVAVATRHLAAVSQQLAQMSAQGTAQRVALITRVAADGAIRRAATAGLPGDAGTALGGPVDAATADAARRAIQGVVPVADSTHEAWELRSADGARRVAEGDSLDPVDEAPLRAAMREAARTDSVRYSAFYADHQHVYTWAVAPVREAGHLVGYLAERRHVGNTARAERSIRELTGEDVSVLFASPSSGVWASLRGTPAAAPFEQPLVDGVFETTTAAGARTLSAGARVAGTPFALVLGVPEATVLAGPRAFLRRMLGIGVLLLLLGAAAAWALSRQVTQPLRAMTFAAEAVAGGDYRQRVALTRRDELGRLGATFNAMAERIGASHMELAAQVQESTALASALEVRNDELRGAQHETLRAVGRTERLQRVTAVLAGALDFTAVASAIVGDGVAAAEAASGSLFLLSSDGGSLELVRSHGQPSAAIAGWQRLPLDSRTPVAEAARTQSPVFVGSPEAWAAADRGDVAPPVGRSWAGLPLVARGRTIGAVGLSFAEAQPFDGDARAFLVAFSQQCAQALDRALLFDAAVHARHAAEEARAVAQSANAAKSAFLAMMSHELRTPLNAIGGYAQLIELGIHGPVSDQQRESLERIRRSQRHLLSIIEDILNLARIEAGQIAVSIADVALDAVAAEVESLIAPQAAARGVRYEATPAPGLVVRADRDKLQQVLLNVVANAVRFTEPGGLVRLSAAAADGEALVRIADTGVGIPADKLEAVFEPFVQVDAGLTRRTGGTGLGLAISRDLVRAMGGRIEVESEVGRGSTFTVVVPRAAA